MTGKKHDDDAETHEKKPDDKLITKHELDELTDTLKRIQAEFENYKKRTEKETKLVTVEELSKVLSI